MTRPVAALAALLILGGALSGCSPSGASAPASQDPSAGLDGEILKWRTEIMKSDPLCQSQVADQKCASFEVSCKALRTITPDEQAKGMTFKVVAAINWSGYDAKRKQAQQAARSAQFSKTGGTWTRAEHSPVNPNSCADL